MVSLQACFLLALLCLKVAYAVPADGKEIADKFGEDLSFASKQVIRGFTAIFGPLLDSAQNYQPKLPGSKSAGLGEHDRTFQNVLLRDGINAIGKGVKASATILSSPARVVGTGLEEAKKVGQANQPKTERPPMVMDDRSKIASTLLNTTAAEFSQANLGAVLVEVALKKRIKDIGNRTASVVDSQRSKDIIARSADGVKNSPGEVAEEVQSRTSSQTDALIERFNEAVKKNDERVLSALQVILAQINSPKN